MPRIALLVLATLAAAEGAAGAEVRDPLAVPHRSVGLALVFGGGQFGGMSNGGAAPKLEIAWGRRRTQLFLEGALGIAGIAEHTAFSARGGGGVRWLARSFAADEAAFDLFFEGVADVERFEWDGGGHTQPTVGVGAGWQVRNPRSGFTLRIGTRVFVAPFEDTPPAMPTTPAAPNFGFMGQFGAAW